MPIFKEGKYGEIGQWGRKRKFRLPSKKLLSLIVILLVLASIFAISKNNVIPIVLGDYNTSFSHTRTPIFTDNKFTGVASPTFDFVNGPPGPPSGILCSGCTSPQTTGTPSTVVSGEAIIVEIDSSGSPSLTVTDSQSNTYTSYSVPTIDASAINTFTATASSSGSITWTVTFTGTQSFVASFFGYKGVTGFQGFNSITGTVANSGSNSLSPTVTSGFTFGHIEVIDRLGTSTLTSGGTKRQDAGIATYSPNFKMGSSDESSNTDTWTWGGSGSACSPNCAIIQTVLSLTFSSSPLSSPNVRWNFNSTCVTLGVVNAARFDFSKGSSGSGGLNCSSADIMISKASANLQTAAGRMLEMVQAWNPEAVTTGVTLQNVSLILRTNSTLPSFTENYNPFKDTQARLIWNGCPAFICTNGLQTLYVGHDNTKSISTESTANDLVINGTLDAFKANTQEPFQVVLNFTGPNNFMSQSASANDTISTKTASSLQMGQDYYILVQAVFKGSPCNNCFVLFLSGQPVGSGNPSLGIWSVPASCNDPLNQASCSGNGTPVFQFNPLDPSSWGNAIIKGMLWVGTVAIPQGFVVMTRVIATTIQITGDAIGGFFGWGPIGTNIVTFFSGVVPLFASIGTALGWLGSLVTSSGSIITLLGSFTSTYFPGLSNLLSDFSNGGPEVISIVGEVAIWLPNSYMIVLLFFYFLLVMMNGMKGFFDWIRLVKWSSFSLFNVFARFLKLFIDAVTWLLGRLSIISPGHESADDSKGASIPMLHPGPIPHIDLHVQEMALFHDPTAWFFGTVGFVFLALFAGSSASGLPAGSVTIISGMGPLFLVLFGTMFMMMILYIPMFILGKLKEHT